MNMNDQTRNHQRATGADIEPRNPFQVLNVTPVFAEPLRKSLAVAHACMNHMRGEIASLLPSDVTIFDHHPVVAKTLRELRRLEESAEDAEETPAARIIRNERMSDLHAFLRDYRSYLALREENLPKIDEPEAPRALVMQSSLSAYRDELLRAIELEEKILGIERVIRDAHYDLALLFHPDREKNSPAARQRFDELDKARNQLSEGDQDQRMILALNLVTGQRTELWSAEMRTAAGPLIRDFGPIFALGQPLAGETVPCEACRGTGNKPVQRPNDFFPVPVVCEDCRGYGALPKATADFARALESAPIRKHKK